MLPDESIRRRFAIPGTPPMEISGLVPKNAPRGLDSTTGADYICMVVQIGKRVSEERKACRTSLRGLLSPRLFKALSDPKRLSLLIRLAEGREACTVGRVAQGSGVDLSVVSRHLAVLREAGIIKCDKRGKEVWCVVQTAAIVKILRDLADALEVCCLDGRCTGMPSELTPRRSAVPRKRGRPVT